MAANGSSYPDWLEGNKSLVHPLFQATALQYAKEKGITPGIAPRSPEGKGEREDQSSRSVFKPER